MPTAPPVKARRSQASRSATTRTALVAAARRLFAEQGFAAVGTETIVAAAGVTRGALYHQFADKTALFATVLDEVEADIAARLSAEVASATADPIEAVRQSARAWLRICVEPDIQRVVLVDGPSVLGWTTWREICRRHVFGLVHAMIEQAVAVGRIRSSASLPLAHVLMGASDEAALYVAQASDPEAARAEMIVALEALIDGVAVGSDASGGAVGEDGGRR